MQDLYNNIDGGFGQYTVPSSPFSTSTTSTSSKSGGIDYVGVGTKVVDLGVTIWASAEARKNAQKQADALIAQGVSAERVQQLILEGKKLDLETARAGAGTKSGSTVLYVALGVGAVVILGIVIFAVTRKT